MINFFRKIRKQFAGKTQENKCPSVSNGESQMQSGSESTFQFEDNRPEAIAHRKLQEAANNSSAQQQPIQKKENNTGLPDNLKTGMENLSGMSLDDLKVHHNSDKPAQLKAHAYAQGAEIHLGPGQEKHLPHEAWHVVQQKQGRVKPTMQLKGKVNVNDDGGLEQEADVMGAKAVHFYKDIEEQRLSKLIAFNKHGKVDCSSPFPIFGMNPLQNNTFVFSSNEWLTKSLSQITIQLIWEKDSLPKSFKSHYKDYNGNYDNSSFKINFKRLYMGISYSINEMPLNLFHWNDDDDTILPSSTFYLDLNKNVAPSKPMDKYVPLNIIKPHYWEGAILIELIAPDSGFGSDLYLQEMASYGQRIRKNKLLTAPMTPYIPMVDKINVIMTYRITDHFTALPTDEFSSKE